MNWLEIYKPIYLNQIKHNINEIKKAKEWIENYKKDYNNSKKVCLIVGSTGIGKTLLAELLFKEYNFDKIELNSGDIRSQKKLGEFLKKTLSYKNVIDMFNNGNRPIGILLDEIDTICKLSDKGGFNEFLSILKNNDKILASKKTCSEKKSRKSTKKVFTDDYIKLYNPIICTSDDINDKKINDLKKYSIVISLNKLTHEEMNSIIDEIYLKNEQSIDTIAKNMICNHVNGDVRLLIILLEDLYNHSKGETITKELFESYKKIFSSKNEDVHLIESTRLLMTKNMSIKESQKYFDVECLLIPLMMYHNSLNYIKKSDDNIKNKLKIYKNIMESLCIHDTIQTNIYESQDWNELYDIASIYGASIPNYNFMQLKNKCQNIPDIEFTCLLNKISQMYTNKKSLNNSRFSIGKVNIDNDEILFLTEILYYYYEQYKKVYNNELDSGFDIHLNDEIDNNSDNGNDNNDDCLNENNDNDDDTIEFYKYVKPSNKVKNKIKSINDDNNKKSNLINFMNKYNISMDDLENLLKNDKFNKNIDNKRKKFTIRIKKNISGNLLQENIKL